MQSINSFFQGIKTDFQIFANKQEENSTKNLRITSIALRILGAGIAVFATSAFIAGITAVKGSALAGLGLLASTLFLAIIAHDCIKIGTNISNENALYGASAPKSNPVTDILNRGVAGGKMIFHEIQNETPYKIHDTLLVEPLYKLSYSSMGQEDA